MTQFVFANNAATTLGSAASSSTTTLALATGTGALFPTPAAGQQFAITLSPASSSTGTPFEICYCTAVSGDTLTVIRAQEGTTGLTWNVGDFVQSRWTKGQAAALAQQVDVQKQVGNYGADTGTVNAGIVTLNPVPVSLTALIGVPIRVLKINSTNTGAYTLNVNGLGAKNVYFQGVALTAGDLLASQIFEVFFDGTQYELLSTPGVTVPGGPAGGVLTGTYPNPGLAANVVGTSNLILNAATNAVLAQMAATTVKANTSGSTANASDVTLTAFLTALGITFGNNGSGYWVKFPNGLYIQGGEISTSSGTGAVTWPHALASTVIGSCATANQNGTPACVCQFQTGSWSTTGATIQTYGTNGVAQTVSVSWIMFGI